MQKTSYKNQRIIFVKGSRAISMPERIAEYDKVMHNTSLKVSHTASETHSQILRKELYASNITAPPYGNSCHHIIEWDAKDASIARDILEKYRIDFDSAANGVLLPYENNGYVTTEAMHNGGHSSEYYKTVNNRLESIDEFIKARNLSASESKMLISEELHNIRKDLLSGVLKVHN
ncbi:AHH domain-containing protein [Clostridium septicum]|uniref:AHH domain-containing protein n=1 Tax=Clostridium septicum TaxID=1504 RepID=UPI003216CB53